MGALKSCMLSYHSEELKSIGVHMSALELWKLLSGGVSRDVASCKYSKIMQDKPQGNPSSLVPYIAGLLSPKP